MYSCFENTCIFGVHIVKKIYSDLAALRHADTFFLTAHQNVTFELHFNDPLMQTMDDSVISGRRWSASDRYRRYGLLIMVGGVCCISGDFSQTSYLYLFRRTHFRPQQYNIISNILHSKYNGTSLKTQNQNMCAKAHFY